MNMKKSRHGFSLLELIIVFMLVVFLASIASVGFTFFDRSLVHCELDTLVMCCRKLQQEAQFLQMTKELIINRKQHSYEINGRHYQLAQGVKFAMPQKGLGRPSSPQHPLASSSTFLKDKIIFYPDGIISSGTLFLSDAKQNIFYALSVPVSQVSYIRRYVFKKNSWELLP